VSDHTSARHPAPDVAQEILGGSGLSMSQAARRFPSYRRDRPVNPSTIWRWINEGVKLPDGQRVRLEAARLGGRWLTSIPALARFLEAQTPHLGADTPRPRAASGAPPALHTPRERRQAADRAGEELTIIGI
jgi:hypothetical protein